MDLLTVASDFGLTLIPVQLEPRTGEGPYGPVYGVSSAVPAIVDQTRKLVRDAQGEQVISETTVYVQLGTPCPDGSRVTLPDGHVTTVLSTSPHRGHGNSELPECLEITCE